MNETNDAKDLEKTIDAKKEKAASLDLEEKAELITSELGKKTTGSHYYPPAGVGGDFDSTYRRERYVGKTVPCSECALEIITWTEDFGDKNGKKETIIYTRKQLLFPFLYKSKLVYASEATLEEPEKIKVNAFRDKDKWLDDFELLYARTKLDRSIREAIKTARDNAASELKKG